MASKKRQVTEEEREFFIQRYNFIYKELDRLQSGMDEMEACAAKLLRELQELRDKETETFEDNGED
jgi:hypothetical protein